MESESATAESAQSGLSEELTDESAVEYTFDKSTDLSASVELPSFATTGSTATSEQETSLADEQMLSDLTDPSLYSAMSSLAESELTPVPIWKRPVLGRRIYVLRNGERVDRRFPDWPLACFNEKGEYKQTDLNQPLALLKRVGGPEGYKRDSPVTEIGKLMARMIGRTMRLNNVFVDRVYVSPALRCVDTARSLMKELQPLTLEMCIEPGLFEYLGLYPDSVPKWMTADELLAADYKVNKAYQPVISEQDIGVRLSESVGPFYRRCKEVVRKILDINTTAGNIVMVVHSSTMDAIARALLGLRLGAWPQDEIEKMGNRYPYLALVVFEELKDKTWYTEDQFTPALTHRGFTNEVDMAYLHRR